MSFEQLRSSYFKNLNQNDFDYSRQALAAVPLSPSSLAIPFSSTDYTNVFNEDGVTVDQTSNATNTIAAFVFKGRNEIADYTASGLLAIAPSIHWQGTSTVNAASATVFLDVFNFQSGSWENVASDTTTLAGTTILLQAQVISVTDNRYYNGNQSAWRVYQNSSGVTLSTDEVEVYFDPGFAPPSIPSTISVNMAATADDVEELVSTLLSVSNAQDTIGNTASSYSTGLRFQNVTIPIGSTITNAAFLWNIGTVGGTGTKLYTIKGILEANPATWNNTTRRPSQLAKTIASVNGTVINTQTGAQSSADFTAVVQELVNQGAWASGNAMSFAVLDNSNSFSNYFKIYDYTGGGSAKAAVLKISYTSSVTTSTSSTTSTSTTSTSSSTSTSTTSTSSSTSTTSTSSSTSTSTTSTSSSTSTTSTSKSTSTSTTSTSSSTSTSTTSTSSSTSTTSTSSSTSTSTTSTSKSTSTSTTSTSSSTSTSTTSTSSSTSTTSTSSSTSTSTTSTSSSTTTSTSTSTTVSVTTSTSTTSTSSSTSSSTSTTSTSISTSTSTTSTSTSKTTSTSTTSTSSSTSISTSTSTTASVSVTTSTSSSSSTSTSTTITMPYTFNVERIEQNILRREDLPSISIDE